MTCLRPFSVDDLFRFNNVNLDPLTETYGLTFYLQYLARWPEYFTVAENPAGEIMGYIMGKAEGHGDLDRAPNSQGDLGAGQKEKVCTGRLVQTSSNYKMRSKKSNHPDPDQADGPIGLKFCMHALLD